ncbi:MAG: Gfo/Idh/MocA family oxidoreductase, partial [Opitutaceae bacterium]|nr:Gfo/Idh/MocA family oxidoreductase [Opitutaceae bacterium]
ALPSRRRFLRTVGTAAVAAPFIARSLRAAAPSGILRHASFGSAGMAWADVQSIMTNPFMKLVAVAEVDTARAKQLKETFPEVKVYQDWRQMLDKEGKNIDTVNVSTPDHMHAPMAMSAMQLGKHVYCQKPLAHDIHEVRMLTNYAREKRLVTQMGIQIHSYKVYRQAVALVQSGAIGKVKEVHTWSSKKWGDSGRPPERQDAVPANFNWDLWLGTAAARPFVSGYYHPGQWRKRLDFGTGTFGDMGCHIFDPVFNALALTSPLSIKSEGPAPDAWNWSINARIHYVFPGTKYTEGPTVPVTWYDGDARPPADIRALVNMSADGSIKGAKGQKKRGDDDSQGSIIIGTKGVLHVPHVAAPKLFPQEKFKDFPLPALEQGHHWSIWAEACRNGGKPSADFDYSGPMTEAVLLGSVAVRFPNQTLNWSGAKLEFTNVAAANQHLRRTYRKGWEVAGL